MFGKCHEYYKIEFPGAPLKNVTQVKWSEFYNTPCAATHMQSRMGSIDQWVRFTILLVLGMLLLMGVAKYTKYIWLGTKFVMRGPRAVMRFIDRVIVWMTRTALKIFKWGVYMWLWLVVWFWIAVAVAWFLAPWLFWW